MSNTCWLGDLKLWPTVNRSYPNPQPSHQTLTLDELIGMKKSWNFRPYNPELKINRCYNQSSSAIFMDFLAFYPWTWSVSTKKKTWKTCSDESQWQHPDGRIRQGTDDVPKNVFRSNCRNCLLAMCNQRKTYTCQKDPKSISQIPRSCGRSRFAHCLEAFNSEISASLVGWKLNYTKYWNPTDKRPEKTRDLSGEGFCMDFRRFLHTSSKLIGRRKQHSMAISGS